MRKADVLVAIGVGCLCLGLDALMRERGRLRWTADDAENAEQFWRHRALTAEESLSIRGTAAGGQTLGHDGAPAAKSDMVQPAPVSA